MRYFFSTGEASGELNAVELAACIRRFDPEARFEGIGGPRMREAGFDLWRDHAGWASIGPLAALPRIPENFCARCGAPAAHLARTKPDLVVLVDFGAFNLRLARELRRKHDYALPVLDWFPPAAWLDNEKVARDVASLSVPLTAFERQYAFYKNLQLPVVYFGHPLASRYECRPARPAPPADGGTVALLPGSRGGELRRHVPLLRAAFALLRRRRPRARVVAGAADERVAERLRRAFRDVAGASVVAGVRAALAEADAAWVASGTAVLETALSGVPSVALYVVSPLLARHARRVYSGTYVTLPNLVSHREVVPEYLQEDATPEALAEAMERLLADPSQQYAQLAGVREALGNADALERTARFAVALARAGAQR